MSTDTARDIADGLMAEHAPKPMFSSSPEVSAAQREAFRNAIAAALTAYGAAALEEAAKVADAIGQGDPEGFDEHTPRHIAAAIRALASKEPT